MRCIEVGEHERLTGVLPKDAHSKVDLAYLLVDRQNEWTVLSQSLPLMAKWVNKNVSNGQRWDRVTVTGLFENLNREDGSSGGWHKGRYRVSSVSRQAACDAFNSVRSSHKHAAICSHKHIVDRHA